MTPLRVLVVGHGKVGHGLQRASRAAGSSLTCRLRSLSAVRRTDLDWASLVLLAVPDGAIRGSAEALAALTETPPPVLHLSGSRSVDEASACREHGALHPLASFAARGIAPELEGVHFALGGTPAARRLGRRFATAVGGHVLRSARSTTAPLHGPAYHAAAALVANGSAALAASGVDILTRLGVTPMSARRAVAGLLRTVAYNVEHVGVPSALTGPVMRGDADTVAKHRAALASLGGGSHSVYDAVALAILSCAEDAGLAAEAAAKVRRALTKRVRPT